jgi:hypothetical protein
MPREQHSNLIPFSVIIQQIENSQAETSLDQEKLTPLLRLKYSDSIADAIADLGKPEDTSMVFVGYKNTCANLRPAAQR